VSCTQPLGVPKGEALCGGPSGSHKGRRRSTRSIGLPDGNNATHHHDADTIILFYTPFTLETVAVAVQDLKRSVVATMQATLAATRLPPQQQPLSPTSYDMPRTSGTRFAPLPHIHATITIANSIVCPLINDAAEIHDGNVSFTDPVVRCPQACATTAALRWRLLQGCGWHPDIDGAATGDDTLPPSTPTRTTPHL
jgi:hypothetical protein